MLSLLCILYYFINYWVSVLPTFSAFTVMINTCYDLANSCPLSHMHCSPQHNAHSVSLSPNIMSLFTMFNCLEVYSWLESISRTFSLSSLEAYKTQLCTVKISLCLLLQGTKKSGLECIQHSHL